MLQASVILLSASELHVFYGPLRNEGAFPKAIVASNVVKKQNYVVCRQRQVKLLNVVGRQSVLAETSTLDNHQGSELGCASTKIERDTL